MSILGIDPGRYGALALYNPTTGDLTVHDMPTLQVGKRHLVDATEVARIIDNWSAQIWEVWLEQVATRPGEGAVAAFAFGRGYGVLQGVIAANFLPLQQVTPQSWKKALRVTGNKDESRARASALLPKHAGLWTLKKHEGRAEAALIALYGARQSNPQGAPA